MTTFNIVISVFFCRFSIISIVCRAKVIQKLEWWTVGKRDTYICISYCCWLICLNEYRDFSCTYRCMFKLLWLDMDINLVHVEPYIEMTFKFCTDPHTDSRRLLPSLNDETFRLELLLFFKGPHVYFDKLDFNVICCCGGMRWFNLTIVCFNSAMSKNVTICSKNILYSELFMG